MERAVFPLTAPDFISAGHDMRQIAWTVVVFVLGFAGVAAAQSVTKPASAPGETASVGVAADVKFDVSIGPQGAFLQLVPSVGYDFEAWGAHLGVPLESSSASSTAAGATSHYGLGDLFLRVYYTIGSDRVSWTSIVVGTAPTGDSTIGLGTGQPTWNWTNHLDGGVGWITPFVDAGVGNSINSASSVSVRVGGSGSRPLRTVTIPTRPYTTIGTVTQLDAGLDVEMGALNVSMLAYDTIPRRNQTAVSRFVALLKQPAPSSPTSPRTQTKILPSTKGQRFFEVNAVTEGTASLTRDSGFGASIGIKPTHYLDLSVSYSHSVPMKLDILSVTATTDVASLFRKTPQATATSAIDRRVGLP